MEKFSGATFCFWVSMLVMCFSMVFCLGSSSMTWRFAPESVWKNSLDVRSCVFGFVLSFFVSPPSSFFGCFFRETQIRSNRHTPHCVRWSLPFSFFCPRCAWFIARFGRASFLSRVLSGCHSGPRAYCRFWIFSVPLLRPLLGCGAVWVFVVDFCCRFCFPLLWCLRLFHTLEGRTRRRTGIPPGGSARRSAE